MIILGILLILVGSAFFIATIVWMCWVTVEDHHLGTFFGQLWSTVGQEIVAFFMVLSWAIVVYGFWWILGIPSSWSVFDVCLLLFLPTVLIWSLAKLFSIKEMLIALGSHIIQIIYTVFVLWIAIGLIGIPTFLPTRTVEDYFGDVKNPNQLMWRFGETILVIEQLRFYRSELKDSSTLYRYVVESVERMDYWHSKRESWGGVRNIHKIEYKTQANPLLFMLREPSIDQDPAKRLAATMLVLTTTDTWWIDEITDLPKDVPKEDLIN